MRKFVNVNPKKHLGTVPLIYVRGPIYSYDTKIWSKDVPDILENCLDLVRRGIFIEETFKYYKSLL